MAQTPGNGGPPSFSPPPPLASGPHAVAGGTPAAGGVNEDHERWLIQKEDKMDYGPFPLREVRSQIEKGTISADHMILDMETGDRRRVREHPLLGEMAREWEGRHAQTAMEHRDRTERDRHRASVLKLLSGIVIAVIAIGAPAVYFLVLKKPKEVVKIVKEQVGDDFFKGVEISMKVDPPQPRVKKPHGAKKRVFKNGKWEDSIDLGDASDEGGDETLTGEQVQSVMNKNFKLLGGCLREEAARNPSVKKLDLEFLIKGTGAVSSVKVNGETGSAVASCVFAKMLAVSFPKFNGTKTHAAFSLALK